MVEKRSFPDAANGLPQIPMEVELWAAGCDHDTARFVAHQLGENGYSLIRAQDIGWPEIHAFQDELRRGQGVGEDGGGFVARCIMALFRRKSDPVETYQQAAATLLRKVAEKDDTP